MKRSPIKRRTPLKARVGLKSRKPLNKVSPKQRDRSYILSQIKPPEDGLCQNCHKQSDFRGIAKHHKQFRSDGGDDSNSNIEWLCGKCHSLRHGIIER